MTFTLEKAPPEPMRETRLSKVVPSILVRYVEALRQVRKEVALCYPFETRRSGDRQLWLFRQGRDWPGQIVTAAATLATSWHAAGAAIDSVFIDKNGKVTWNIPLSQWADFGSIMESHGLAWGGRWKRPDSPHVQGLWLPKTPTLDDQKSIMSGSLYELFIKYDLNTVSYFDDVSHI
jgi:D-alanyl-D-alanine carboxypeptidase-like protein